MDTAEAADDQRPSVLVVDDDVAVDDSFGEMLAASGYTVHAEGSCAAAIAYLQTGQPQVLILDMHLPDGTGVECLRRVRALPQHREVPVAILTGDYFLDEKTGKELQTLGARVYFKPVWEEDLLGIVRQLLSAREVPPTPGKES
jgi:CheY-like chemotaxis protein